MIFARVDCGRVVAHHQCEILETRGAWLKVRLLVAGEWQERAVKAAHLYPDDQAPPIEPPRHRHGTGDTRNARKPLRPGHTYGDGGQDR